jgi:hypothetical protein
LDPRVDALVAAIALWSSSAVTSAHTGTIMMSGANTGADMMG